MHGEVVSATVAPGGEGQQQLGIAGLSRGLDWHRRHRQTQRWCALGCVLIPVMLAFLWLQFTAARQGGGRLLYADEYCGCRAQVANWVSDYVWTQMIWLPGNALVLLIWGAMAFKLWGGRRA